MLKAHVRPWMGIVMVALMTLSFAAGTQFRSLACVGANLMAGVGGFASESLSAVEEISLRPVEAFQEVTALLRRNYVAGISEKQEVELGYAAIRGMLAGLRDPYTRFMDPEEYNGFREENQGHFEGIGATLEMTEVPVSPESDKETAKQGALSPFQCAVCGADWVNPLSYRITRASANGFEAEYVSEAPFYREYRISVVAPIPGGPAERVGLKAGDQVVKIDDTSTYGMSMTEAVKRIRGPAGTAISLLIRREGESKPIELEIVRGNIDIPTVEKRVLDGDIGYLRINSFNESSVELTAEGLAELKTKGIKGLVLDLRNNPGGGLEVCLDVTAMFVPHGPIVYIQAKGAEPAPRLAPKQSRGLGLPLVVLVNRGSASASEILAGAVQERGVGKVVGERTFGKGLVQIVRPLKDGSAVAITTAKYMTPKKHEVNERGILPDKEVAQPEGVVRPLSDEDLQAKTAVEMVKEQIALRSASSIRQSRLPATALAR
ncbi:MAG: PDZ domain-containing protein [Armatimonadetes bacterium]|nr:PDZ domain-containing protein [Armatimonadota bacterium]NIO74918.1 PDZ domain-containing protein [Armatimonadota bacterium]NIO96619.1 PDZ domain-containing protein [Armatimonadota bacterium]